MAQCPKCSASVTDDFGLTECGSCHAQLLVHIDGSVEFSGAGTDEVTPVADAPFEDAPAEDAPVEDLPFEEAPYEESAYREMPYEDLNFEAAGAEDAVAANPADEDPALEEAAPPVAEEEYSFDEPEPAPPAAESGSAGNGSPDLSDIASFGNSEASGGRDGALRYNVLVSGIDTVDVRDAFREALTDRKFVWDTDEIIRSIKSGVCAIENVSSVKAHILITRLRQLPVEVEWEQYAIHQT